jgi:hypothetical protein
MTLSTLLLVPLRRFHVSVQSLCTRLTDSGLALGWVMDLAPKGMSPMRNMIPVHLTIGHRHQAWYVAACSVDFGNGITRLIPPTRSFISETAAVNFVKRVVLRALRDQGRLATGSDLECHVKSLAPSTVACDMTSSGAAVSNNESFG